MQGSLRGQDPAALCILLMPLLVLSGFSPCPSACHCPRSRHNQNQAWGSSYTRPQALQQTAGALKSCAGMQLVTGLLLLTRQGTAVCAQQVKAALFMAGAWLLLCLTLLVLFGEGWLQLIIDNIPGVCHGFGRCCDTRSPGCLAAPAPQSRFVSITAAALPSIAGDPCHSST